MGWKVPQDGDPIYNTDGEVIARWHEINDRGVLTPSTKNLVKAKLESLYIHRAQITEDRLRHVDLEGAQLAEAQLENIYLYGVNLRRCNMTNATLKRATIEECDLRDSNCLGATFKETRTINNSMQWADFCGARFADSSLYRNKLVSSTFIRARFERASIRKCDLASATFADADLQDLDFQANGLIDTEIDLVVLHHLPYTVTFTRREIRIGYMSLTPEAWPSYPADDGVKDADMEVYKIFLKHGEDLLRLHAIWLASLEEISCE